MKGTFDLYYASIQWVTYRCRMVLEVRYALLLILLQNVTENDIRACRIFAVSLIISTVHANTKFK